MGALDVVRVELDQREVGAIGQLRQSGGDRRLAGADMAGISKMQYPATAHLIRTMCSGRVSPEMVLRAFRAGADGVKDLVLVVVGGEQDHGYAGQVGLELAGDLHAVHGRQIDIQQDDVGRQVGRCFQR